MNRRCPARLVLCLALTASLPVAHADPVVATAPAAPVTALRMQLQVVDACSLQGGGARTGCNTVHQRSDTPTPPPPQVQALTPPIEGGQVPQRAWQTVTF